MPTRFINATKSCGSRDYNLSMDKPAAHNPADTATLSAALIGDGRPLLTLVALGLILSGLFAIFLTITNSFLPHDVAFLGMQPSELCAIVRPRIPQFGSLVM